MEDVLRCGNIVPKFPGGPPRHGDLVSQTIVASGLTAIVMGSVKLDPRPDPWKQQGGFGY